MAAGHKEPFVCLVSVGLVQTVGSRCSRYAGPLPNQDLAADATAGFARSPVAVVYPMQLSRSRTQNSPANQFPAAVNLNLVLLAAATYAPLMQSQALGSLGQGSHSIRSWAVPAHPSPGPNLDFSPPLYQETGSPASDPKS
ncbi:hypothetical protein P7K49_028283 [Saguinus oedipus]|uniref:Uncharacterized protein n=1 Tax=Saguinus oedipus TaxID=9490 RepID=A0ABQ9UCT0_SAGOE|nr:hypothetical protein P7K49_028283 [Saguinus oedipus]